MDNRMIIEDFHIRALMDFGNTVIAEKRVKKYGIPRIEKKFKEYGLDVKIVKYENRDITKELFSHPQGRKGVLDITYIAELERGRHSEERGIWAEERGTCAERR